MGNWPQGRKCPPPPGLQAKGGLEGPWKLCLGSGSGPIRGPVDTAWAPAPPAHSHRLKRTLCPLTRSLPQPASWRFPAQLRAVLITAAAAPPAPPPALRAAAACAVGRMPGGAPSCPERGVAGAAGARRSWKAVSVQRGLAGPASCPWRSVRRGALGKLCLEVSRGLLRPEPHWIPETRGQPGGAPWPALPAAPCTQGGQSWVTTSQVRPRGLGSRVHRCGRAHLSPVERRGGRGRPEALARSQGSACPAWSHGRSLWPRGPPGLWREKSQGAEARGGAWARSSLPGSRPHPSRRGKGRQGLRLGQRCHPGSLLPPYG